MFGLFVSCLISRLTSLVKFRVGTRSSLLALTQTRLFISQLCAAHPGLEIEEVLIQTKGDINTEPLSQSKTPGLFVSALRDSLLNQDVDIIIHSMKDLPARPLPSVVTACIPIREDSRDGLVSKNNLTLVQLPPGARVGTSSPRRAASIRRVRPDLNVASIRGNIDTRISKVENGEYDATLLAMAGLNRIGRADVVCEIFENDVLVPAAGQGALAVECREDDNVILHLLSSLDDPYSRLVTTAERSVLIGLDAGCATAIGAWASYLQGTLTLRAELSVEDTGETLCIKREVKLGLEDLTQAHDLGIHVAQLMKTNPISERVAWK